MVHLLQGCESPQNQRRLQTYQQPRADAIWARAQPCRAMHTFSGRCTAAYHGGPGGDLTLPVVQGGEWGDDEEGAPVAMLLPQQLQHSNALCCLAQAHLQHVIVHSQMF